VSGNRVGASALIVCLFALTITSVARASPLFELLGGGFGGGGLNARATGASAASTYFNPSLLPKARQGLELGWLVLHDSIQLDLLPRSPSDDVPASAFDRVRTDRPPVPTIWLNQGCSPATGSCVREVPRAPRQGDGSTDSVRGYQMLGLVNHLLGESLTLGLYALVPLQSFTQAHSFFVDEREQFGTNSLHPELLSDRLTPVSLAFGAGSRLWRRLYLGLSFTLGLNNGAAATAYVGNSTRLNETLQLSTRVDVETTVSPHVALSYEPSDRARIGFTLHSPQKVVIDTEFGIYLPNGDVQQARRTATHAYLPWIAAVAGSYDLSPRADRTWELVATIAFERWSRYIDRQSERPSSAYAWRDLATGALGLHFARGPYSAGFDASYRRSPVPDQSGRTNYVDNDRLGMHLGGNFEWPLPSLEVALRFGAQAQVHVLPERKVQKLDPRTTASRKPRDQLVVDEWPDDSIDISTGRVIADAAGLQTNNPGWPGFGSRGYLIAGALTVALLY
jgi:long-chain fatty acid transport protein